MMKIKCICCGKEFDLDCIYSDTGRGNGRSFLALRRLYRQLCCSDICKYETDRALVEAYYGGFQEDLS